MRGSAFRLVLYSGVCEALPLMAHPQRSPTMRAQRAKLKSWRDDMIIAPGKRSAARGCGPRMISSFFSSGLARLRRAKPEEKKEVRWGVSLPRAAASVALPWATIRPPLRGSGTANQTIEPIAACASVCKGAGTIATRGFRRRSVSGGCGSAWRSTKRILSPLSENL
jgi:hypothetical protein